MQRIPPTDLVDARLELHFAAQVVSAWADAWLPERADDGHTSMRWDTPSMIGERAADGAALAVRAVDFAILALHADHIEALPLAGETLESAMRWADRQFGAPRGIHIRAYDMPASPIATGARFVGYPRQLAELARWYDLGLDTITHAIAGASRASAIRIWPHHFDLGAIVYIDAASDRRQIGIGLSPGDGSYAEPYFYVTPSPVADWPTPPLAHGFWHTAGWTGAVLTASSISSAAGAADPERATELVASALETALDAARRLIA